MSESQEPKLAAKIEQAEKALNTISTKVDEASKDNEKLRAEMSEDEVIALDTAKEILDSDNSDDAKQNAKTMQMAAAVALVGETINGFNLAHKVSRAFLAQDEQKGMEKFLSEKMKGVTGKRKSSKRRQLEIEFKKLRRNHVQFQESVTLGGMIETFFKDPIEAASTINAPKERFQEAVKYLEQISGKRNFESLMLSLRYCVKSPMECLYRCFAIAAEKYCKSVGSYDSQQFAKGLAKNLATITVAAMAASKLPADVMAKYDMSILEEFAKAVENFDTDLGHIVATLKTE